MAAADPALVDQVHELVCVQKLPLRKAATILKVPHQYVWKLARTHFPHEPRRTHVAKFLVDEIVEAKLSGESAESIAARVGCNVRHVYTIVQKTLERKIRDALGVEELPASVKPYRCPVHGLVRFKPCIACQAIAASRQRP